MTTDDIIARIPEGSRDFAIQQANARWSEVYQATVDAGYPDTARDAANIAKCIVLESFAVPPRPTPETVLRAMLASYEKAALDAAIAYFRTKDGTEDERAALVLSMRRTMHVDTIRDTLAALLAERDAFAIIEFGDLGADYAARLAGTRPLDAPPLEAP